jgi:hypothetical protein
MVGVALELQQHANEDQSQQKQWQDLPLLAGRA